MKNEESISSLLLIERDDKPLLIAGTIWGLILLLDWETKSIK